MTPSKDLFDPPLKEIKLCNYQLAVGKFKIGLTSSDEFCDKLKLPTDIIRVRDSDTYLKYKNNGTILMRLASEIPLGAEESGGVTTVFNITEAHAMYRVMQREADLKAVTLLKI